MGGRRSVHRRAFTCRSRYACRSRLACKAIRELSTSAATPAGLAKFADRTGTRCGTPLYMAPELLAGSGYDSRADTFAAGVILHELLTGQLPWTIPRRGDMASLQAQILATGKPGFELALPAGVMLRPAAPESAATSASLTRPVTPGAPVEVSETVRRASGSLRPRRCCTLGLLPRCRGRPLPRHRPRTSSASRPQQRLRLLSWARRARSVARRTRRLTQGKAALPLRRCPRSPAKPPGLGRRPAGAPASGAERGRTSPMSRRAFGRAVLRKRPAAAGHGLR